MRADDSARLHAIDVAGLIADSTQLRLVAQPLVDLVRGTVVGYELLSRFELGFPIAPNKVFEAASEQGLGAALDAHVLGHALTLMSGLPSNCFLTVNIDPMHLRSPELWNVVEHADLRRLVLELTEYRAIDDVASVRAAIDKLRARGAVIAIDDAGSGYSGLKQLLELRPQLIKLDRDLITNIDVDEAKLALVQMLGDLAGKLDAWLLAEGIETAGELRALRQLRVPLGQGYFLGKPSAPWTDITSEATDVLYSAPDSSRRHTLAGLADECPTFQGEQAGATGVDICVRIDSDGRPLGLTLLDESGATSRREHELLRVNIHTDAPSVARRTMLRAPKLRWDPVVCVDELGRFVSIVRIPRLMMFLAEQAARAAT